MTLRYYFIFISIILFSPLALINCSDEIISPIPVDSSDFRYPFSDGSTWNYKRTYLISDIRPDSIRHYFNNNPLIINGQVSILYDTIINSINTKCFLDEFTYSNTLYRNRFYYINNDTSLILYAQRRGIFSGFLPLGKVRNNFFNLENDFSNNENLSVFEYMIDTINVTLKYPIVTGTEWSVILTEITTIKKYLGFENIAIPAGTITCMKVISTISYIQDDPIFRYYSKYGLMKSYFFANDIAFTTVTNPKGIGIVDVTDETVVSSYNITSD